MNTIKTAFFLGLLSALIIVVGGQGMLIALVLAAGMNFFSYWFSDKLVLAMHGAQPVSREQAPQLYEILERLTGRNGMPMPRVYLIATESPNAFATGRSPSHAAVAVTEGIMRLLTMQELRGVLAHELSHVANRDILITSVAAAAAMGITFVARIAMWGAIFGGGGGGGRDRDGNVFGALAMMILAPIAAVMLQMALSRSREYEADHSGAELMGNGEPLARALEKIEAYAKQVPMDVDPAQATAYIINPLTGRKVNFSNLFQTHPPTAERIARLRTQY